MYNTTQDSQFEEVTEDFVYNEIPNDMILYTIPPNWIKKGDIGDRDNYIANKLIGEFFEKFNISSIPKSFKVLCHQEITCIGWPAYYFNDCYPIFTGGFVNRCQQILRVQPYGKDKLRIWGMTCGFINEDNSSEIPPHMALFCEQVTNFGYMPSFGYITDNVDDAIEKVLLGLHACDLIST